MSIKSLITGKSDVYIGDQKFVAEHNKLSSPINAHVVTIDAGEHYIQGRGESRDQALANAQEALENKLNPTQSP